MLSHYYTLVHLSREIRNTLVGKVITEIYTQEKNQLRLVTGGDPAWSLVCSCEPTENFLYLREGYTRARKNSVDLLPGARELEIADVRPAPDDRVVILDLRDSRRIRLQFFGARANVLLTETSGDNEDVIDSFLWKKESVGELLQEETRRHGSVERLLRDDIAFLSAVREGGPSAIHGVKAAIPLLGSLLAREIFLRANVDPSAELALVTDRELKRLHAEIAAVIGELSAEHVRPLIYSRGDAPVAFSLLPLRIFEDEQCEEFSSLSVAVQRYVSRMRSSDTFRTEKETLVRRLELEEKKSARILEKIRGVESGSDRSAEYERKGKLIMLHLHELRKGMKSASLGDPADPGGRGDAVALEPALTPVQNAERYFERGKKARAAAEEEGTREKEIRRRLGSIAALRSEAEELHSTELLRRFRQMHAAELSAAGVAASGKRELPPFRIFMVEGGFEVLAGKSSENNDLLTMKYARPDDLWFHCRGSSGSHVILRVSTGKGSPSKEAIMAAASIAAYYSKMKNATMVPVAMTARKYVRKPKGAPAGTVTIEREKVLFAEPKLPAGEGAQDSP